MNINDASDALQVAHIVSQLHAMAQRRAAHDSRQGVAAHMLDVLELVTDAAVSAADVAEDHPAAPPPVPIH